jgi:hypothetical protein
MQAFIPEGFHTPEKIGQRRSQRGLEVEVIEFTLNDV